jgi:hypothetical protein
MSWNGGGAPLFWDGATAIARRFSFFEPAFSFLKNSSRVCIFEDCLRAPFSRFSRLYRLGEWGVWLSRVVLEKSLSFWVRAMSLPVHNGARRGGAGTLWVRMASLRAIAPATFASSRRSGDASAPKTRCVATVARRGAASGRAESALTRKVRHSPRGPAPGRIHSRLSPPFEEPFAFPRAALAARFARAAPRRAPRATGPRGVDV